MYQELKEKTTRDIVNYSRNVTDGEYGRAPKKKMSSNLFRKELLGAGLHGALIVTQELLKCYRNGEYESMDILIGDLQLLTTENYQKIKKTFNLRVSGFTLEECIEGGPFVGGKNNGEEQQGK